MGGGEAMSWCKEKELGQWCNHRQEETNEESLGKVYLREVRPKGLRLKCDTIFQMLFVKVWLL